MLNPLSWREALTTNDEQRYYRAVELLKSARLEYCVKVRSMSRGGSRRGSTLGTDTRYMCSYQIYVKKPDLERARHVCRV